MPVSVTISKHDYFPPRSKNQTESYEDNRETHCWV
jgi:hypothetical protein